MKRYNAVGMDADFDTVRFRVNKNGKFIIIDELITLANDRIKYYKKQINRNDDEQLGIMDCGLGITGIKMTEKQRKKAYHELNDSTIFLHGKIEALEWIIHEVK